ncbi:hypothetical protein AB0H76_37115 [Nocardia sp. NPDC050712]|uniref:hypothetical protein n=1 Tax=Nocardia sp. NPDC050712 TaxID=3155518 RepID=UPI0033EBB65C
MTRPDDETRGESAPDHAQSADQAPAGQASNTDDATPPEPAETPADQADDSEAGAPEDDVAEEPDLGFAVEGEERQPDPAERATALIHEIARTLAVAGPPGWRQLEAVFKLTTNAELATISFSDDEQRSARVQPSPEVLGLVRRLRELSAEFSDGPWWRLLLSLSSVGAIEVDYDYGDEPFPDDQLFPPEAYVMDLAVYPRAALPVWLGAYLRHGDRQSRPAPRAAEQAREDRAEGVRAILSESDFPPFPVLWARWSVMAAAFVAAGSQWGPRVLPALGFFEGSRRSGSTLYALPGGRAVLSGGVWNAPELDRVYNSGAPMPRLYAGAPEWVANPVLNSRAAAGALSFCYWWQAGYWYRGESPSAGALAEAVPGIWTAETVVEVVSGLVSEVPSDAQRATVATLVSAAEAGVVTRETLTEVFSAEAGFDVDSAFYQLTMAGVALTLPEPMVPEEAIFRVRQFALGRNLDTGDYPLENLTAERISVGWMVFVPTAPGEIAIGRMIFYVADDGVLEQSSSSVAPSVFITEFERRYQQRHTSADR